MAAAQRVRLLLASSNMSRSHAPVIVAPVGSSALVTSVAHGDFLTQQSELLQTVANSTHLAPTVLAAAEALPVHTLIDRGMDEATTEKDLESAAVRELTIEGADGSSAANTVHESSDTLKTWFREPIVLDSALSGAGERYANHHLHVPDSIRHGYVDPHHIVVLVL
jgi:hypothetical protein